MSRIVTLYLLHFPEPYFHARHYAGVTQRPDLRLRMTEHLSSQGNGLVRAVAQRLAITDPEELIARLLVATWKGTRDDERRIKKLKNMRDICPVCRATRGLGPWTPRTLQLEGGSTECFHSLA